MSLEGWVRGQTLPYQAVSMGTNLQKALSVDTELLVEELALFPGSRATSLKPPSLPLSLLPPVILLATHSKE